MADRHEQEEKSLSHEIRDMILERATDFLQWMKPAASDPLSVQVAKLILKVPVFLLVLLLSPVALVVLVFTFVVVI